MQFTPKRKLAAGAATLVAVGGITGGAIAATSGSSRQAFVNDAAKRLNVSPQQLQSAMQGAYTDQLNAAVASGRLSRTQEQRIEQRIQQHGGTPWLRMRSGRRKLAVGGLRVAAKYLGVPRKELRSELRGGKSLAQVAGAQGKSVSGLETALTNAAKTRLQKAVSNGRISSAQEQKVLAKLPTRIEKLINRQGLGKRMQNAHG